MSGNGHRLIAFTLGQCPDHKGRDIEDVWRLSRFWLEHTHDIIQWLFPIPEAGRFNGFAPLLDAQAQAAFAESDELRARQRQSLDVMLDFFGLAREPDGIVALPHLNPRDHIWLKRGGHNHLRISRMIRSLHLCHQPELARAFQAAVIGIGTQQGFVSAQSVDYWRAANQP